jgi:hypothetical protein
VGEGVKGDAPLAGATAKPPYERRKGMATQENTGEYGGFGEDYLDSDLLDYKWDLIPVTPPKGNDNYKQIFMPAKATK